MGKRHFGWTLALHAGALGAGVSALLASGTAAWAGDRETAQATVDTRAAVEQPKIIAWRRDIHEHPELGNQETRTAALVAKHLKSLGLEVRTGVAKTGVVAVLKGGKPGPVVALRADMDALPVTEQVDLPFASKVKTQYEGHEVGVMHACGHDTHVAMLMGVAEVLAGMKDQLPGTVKFIFQPAEEGLAKGEVGGAEQMLKEGAFENPKPDAVFGVHVISTLHAGDVGYRPGPFMAAADEFVITVHGRQSHGALPWTGVDPIVTASQIVLGLQTIESRQMEVIKEPSILSVGSIHGGNRNNIIPDTVTLNGTIRTFDEGMRADIDKRLRRTVAGIAESAGATADVDIIKGYPVTINNPELTAKIVPTLQRVAGKDHVKLIDKVTPSEDFSFYEQHVPGVYLFVGITPPETDLSKAASNHSPKFFVDESGLIVGARTLAHLTVDYLYGL
ncbi:M20 family peptidase [Nitrospirillum viridazoti Y2]|uniref:Carboxypeptidase Ss1 n=1 Tax=Nitrospirillum amazonense TaxID=28077 RepID=A0A560IHZ0_9PROT|nr:amidohydrolase [Nitrospirillum amazonense]EGY00965.1 M20 family peptidase [Nitrospirillum amazonense Y2]TWB58663.1 carboxypeptidase Ss1 [Nitrospirillum amazonense]